VAWLLEERDAPAITVLVRCGEPARAGWLEPAGCVRAGRAARANVDGRRHRDRGAHARSEDEHQRILAKSDAGCRFFVTQAVYDVTSTLSLLSDYALALERGEASAVTHRAHLLALRFTQDARVHEMARIRFPRWLENELRFTRDPLATSLDLCERIFPRGLDLRARQGHPLGVNVESVSIRKPKSKPPSN